jgi:hypothetical protein
VPGRRSNSERPFMLWTIIAIWVAIGFLACLTGCDY